MKFPTGLPTVVKGHKMYGPIVINIGLYDVDCVLTKQINSVDKTPFYGK